jgi:hypothetical protein
VDAGARRRSDVTPQKEAELMLSWLQDNKRGGFYFPAGVFSVTTGEGNREPSAPVNSSFVPSS